MTAATANGDPLFHGLKLATNVTIRKAVVTGIRKDLDSKIKNWLESDGLPLYDGDQPHIIKLRLKENSGRWKQLGKDLW